MDIDDDIKQLRSSDLFATLSEDELRLLYSVMRRLTIKSGDILVREGDVSDCLYVLLRGRLSVATEDGSIVGQVMRGQSVGEMGLITSGKRSATVTAVRESVLLSLNQENFQQLWEKHPSVLFEMTKIITRRLAKTQSIKKTNRDTNIVVFKANQAVKVNYFMQELSKAFEKQCRYRVLKRSDFSSDASVADMCSVIKKMEGGYDYIFYEADIFDLDWRDVCLEFADRIVVLAPGAGAVEPDAELVRLLTDGRVHESLKKILVLLYDKGVKPKNTQAWLQLIPFFRHHHVRLEEASDYARLIRFLNGTAIGLVLGGGGCRVWAEIGAMKYILEQNIPIDALAGTSAGALNAAILSITDNFDDYLKLSQEIGRRTNFSEYTLPFASLLSSKSITGALHTIFGDRLIEDLPRDLFCVAADLVSSQEVDINTGPLWRAVRASISIPGVYPPVYDEQRMLVDGGVVNNLPVDVLKNHFEGLGKIIAIDISQMNNGGVPYHYPLELTWTRVLWHKFFSRRERFLMPSITDIFLKGLLVASNRKSSENVQLSDIFIRPNLKGFGLLDASKGPELVGLGYQAAAAALKDWPTVLGLFSEKKG